MKLNSYLLILLLILPFGKIYSWGFEGHKLIARKAVEILPEEMKDFTRWKDYITEHSIDADERKKTDPDEFHKHFIDIDYYDEFNSGKMIRNKSELISVYNDSIVNAMGVLPWVTVETFENLKKAFKSGERDKILIYASDLAHYVADGHQPMHTILNYDGQLTNQKGIHFRYEITMLEEFLNELEKSIEVNSVEYVDDPFNYVFDYITDSNSLAKILFAADNFAFNKTNDRTGEEYFNLLWFKTKYVTSIQISNSIKATASLIYTAWKDAGSPELLQIN